LLIFVTRAVSGGWRTERGKHGNPMANQFRCKLRQTVVMVVTPATTSRVTIATTTGDRGLSALANGF